MCLCIVLLNVECCHSFCNLLQAPADNQILGQLASPLSVNSTDHHFLKSTKWRNHQDSTSTYTHDNLKYICFKYFNIKIIQVNKIRLKKIRILHKHHLSYMTQHTLCHRVLSLYQLYHQIQSPACICPFQLEYQSAHQ